MRHFVRQLLLVFMLGGLMCACWGASATAAPYKVDLATAANVTIKGAAASDSAGWALAPAGDINGDGRQDLTVTANYADDNGRSSSGSVYVVFGQASPTDVDLAALGTKGYRIEGASATDYTGVSVDAAGDLNGDGKGDLIIGAYNASVGSKAAAGSVYIVFGKASTTAIDLASLGSQGYRIDGAAAGDSLGGSVANAGDLNGDGKPDQIIGAGGAGNNGRSGSGSTYIVFGKSSTTTIDLASLGTQGYRIDGAVGGDANGSKVANAGDLNGDGKPDQIIGSPLADNNGRSNSGSAYVVFGKSSTTTIDLASLGSQGYRVDGAAVDDEIGYALDDAGDVNGDGKPDLIVGSGGADNNGRSNSGSAYVVFGKSSTAPIDLGSLLNQGYRIDGAAAGDSAQTLENASLSVANVGDVNGDGVPDQVVGTPFSDNNGRTNSGSAYVVFGRATTAFAIDLNNLGTQGYEIDGAAANDQLGETVASAGDVNADGRPDVFVASTQAAPSGRTGAGTAYIVYSDSTAPTSSLSYNAGTRADLQYWDAANSRLYYSPTATGSFTLSDTATDTGSGVSGVDFPGLSTTGFTGTALSDSASPFTSNTYTFTTANTTAPASQPVVVSDGQGNRATSTVSFVRDATGPVTSITGVPATVRNGQVLTANATDAGVGVDSVAFRYCPGTTCAWGSGTAVGSADTSAPYAVTWSGQPADGQYTIIARATDKLGNTTDATQTVRIDTAAPTGAAILVTEGGRADLQSWRPGTNTLYYNPAATGTFTVSGSATDPSGIGSVDFPAISDPGLTGNAFSDNASPFGSSTYTFTTANAAAPTGKTVSFRDGAGNTATQTLNFVRDATAPTAAIDSVSGPLTNGDALTTSASDGASGVFSVAYRYCPGASCSWTSGVAIGSASTSAPYSVVWSGQPADGTYTVVARVTDEVGNSSDATRTVALDNTGPSGALSIVKGTGANREYYDTAAGRLFYNPSAAGDFRIAAAPTDPSGVASVDFPTIAQTGFAGTAATASSAPWQSDVYSFDATNMVAPTARTVTYTDTLGHNATATLSFARDMASPSGGSVSYPSGDVSSSSIPITVAAGTDSGAGIAAGSGVVERQESSSGCASFGGWSAVPATDTTTVAGRCYRYRYRISDRVGNEQTYTSANTLQRTSPPAPPPSRHPPRADRPAPRHPARARSLAAATPCTTAPPTPSRRRRLPRAPNAPRRSRRSRSR